MQTILITGASSDVSIAYLKKINKKTKVLAFVNSNLDFLEKIDNTYLDIIPVVCNFLDENALNKALEFIKQFDIDTVIHLAASPIKLERFSSQNVDNFEKDLRIQVLSIFKILQVVLKKMKKKKSGKVIFMLSSVTIGKTPKYLSSYVSSKYALLGLFNSLLTEYVGSGIVFNALSPSMIESKFLNNINDMQKEMILQNHPLKRLLTSCEVADFLKYVVDNENPIIFGNNFNLSGGEIF